MFTQNYVIIPALRICIRLYDTHGNAQEIVDKKNAAAFIRWRDEYAIADHSGQDGFERLAHAKPGKTIAFVKGVKYICTDKQIGHIENGKIYDSKDGPVRSGGICMYTCIGETAPGVMAVWLTYWQNKNKGTKQNE